MPNGLILYHNKIRKWVTDRINDIPIFSGSTQSADGAKGLVPAPTINDSESLLCGDGAWKNVSIITKQVIDDLDWNTQITKIGDKFYHYVKIGNLYWTVENLDFQASGISINPSDKPSTPAAWYYNRDEATYGWEGKKYGLLYNWYAAKLLEIDGWHLPSADEWDALATAVGGASNAGTKLKSTTQWGSGNGTDNYGFTAYPAGYYNGSFWDLGSYAYFWTSSEYNSNVYFRYLDADTSLNSDYYEKINGYSVRLVKNVN